MTRAGARWKAFDAGGVLVPTLGLSAFLLAWLPSFLGETYGYFIDELYFLACSERLALGYVDHPPLSIVLLRGVREILGDSLPALRLMPALAWAATVLLTGGIARRLGAGPLGQALAAGAVLAAPVYHVLFGYYSMNAFSVLLWTSCLAILVEIERRQEPRLWLAFGAVAGLGLENKHPIALLALALGVGLVLTPARRHLTGRWLWAGLAIAFFLLVPNLVWQAAHGWPSLEFYRNADALKNLPTPPLAVLGQQVLALNPGTLPIWLAGLGFFLTAKRGRPYRHIGWIYLVLLGLALAGQKSRPDRIAGVYPILFAGGGVLLGELRGRWRLAPLALLVVSALALAPVGLPILPPRLATDYATALGVVPQIEKGEEKRSPLPPWLADRAGWQAFVADVEAVVATLDPAERRRAILFASNYGRAAALEVLGSAGLPPVYSPHNAYFFWGPPEEPVELAIAVGFGTLGDDGALEPEDPLPRLFADIELAAVHRCEWCMPWRDGTPIWIARSPTISLREAWPALKLYR